ncbi:LysR family transcriptional regulator substrate-binding protein, partial [Phascolarctobacterium succinatutens]|uniref:LysR family transcriptional regulator substrate-binding protein n=1 Tax=Phascolarctobacterium succinatutens TaxID=626940 RepID=UPI0026F0ECCD
MKIGGTHYMNAYLLPSYIAQFNTLYPNINITMAETSSDMLIEMLKDNKLDFTFSCDEDVVSEFDSYPTFSDHILLAVPQSFALSDKLLAQSLSAIEVK